MELDRQLNVGDRVRVLPEDEIRKKMDLCFRMPEADGNQLNFASDMFKYCGMECVVSGAWLDHRVRLKRADNGKDIGWIWCPSMLEDVEEDIMEAPDPSGLFAWIAG